MSNHPSSEADHCDSLIDANNFAEVASGVYRRFDAPTFAAAIRYAVANQLTADNPTIMLMFIRIAEVYPAAATFLTARREMADGNERMAIDLILEPPDEIRQAKYLPEAIQSPGEMDLCWAEFLVTGDIKMVEKVVSVLDRDDRTRAFIEQQLSAPSPNLEIGDDERMTLQHVGIGIGKLSEKTGWEIMTPGDTDLFIWLGVKNQNQVCQKVLDSMDDSLKLHVATKGAALWSLQANASQHGKVRMVCQEAAEVKKGFGRTLLQPQ